MKIAILSDIHANSFALQSVLNEIDRQKIQKLIILGDIFGYYPWAVETYQMLSSRTATAIKGNHDVLVLQKDMPNPCPPYWRAAKDNERTLKEKCPAAITWLKNLDLKMEMAIEDISFSLFHGTPDDPSEGRFFPDNEETYPWFPKKREILLLGHTHYPLEKSFPEGGMIINPGSVGQPRDGDPNSSWCILETKNLSVNWQRTKYNYQEPIELLEKMNWDRRSIAALQKTTKGKLLTT